MDIYGSSISKGYGLYKVHGVPDKPETRKRVFIAGYDDYNEAVDAMRVTVENRYDDLFEYNRNLILGGKGVRFEHIDPETKRTDEYTEYYIKEIGLIM